MRNQELREDVAKRLRFFRKMKGVTAKQMSIDIGKAEKYISRIEEGKVLPSLDAFVDIISYLGVTCDFFMKAEI